MAVRRRMGVGDLLSLSLYWFGLNFHWTALLVVIIPAEILRFAPETEKGTALASVLGWATSWIQATSAGVPGSGTVPSDDQEEPFHVRCLTTSVSSP